MCAPPMTEASGTRRHTAREPARRAALAELNATIYVLRALAYIGEDDALTGAGGCCALSSVRRNHRL